VSIAVSERYNASFLVERNVEAGRGDKPAYLAPDATLTYDGLRRQVNRAGHLLRALGIRREDRVLMVLDDTTAFPTLFLGAMKIGAVPVPVGPLDRLDDVLAAALHVVVGPDGHRLELFLGSHHVLDGVPEFFGQLTVRDKHESDHSRVAPVMACFSAHL